ncbi:LuxR C-terminal-related transcriptional regulator [Streptomyces longwoodensis]|uniref:LuxR C-terminal-related transcriptional regulator n=1 Tax=Streptomyces longwoodensis TaxID=68231 RepID=UPI00224C89F9|nr:LuxR C-terminal-related transcriptional regulator [Streptomyces longwoodensis]MCX5000573.1 LuxR C-terminal-related transcriptional regulator [Streptomyces longwoodensis]
MRAGTTSTRWPLIARDGELTAAVTALTERSTKALILAGPAGTGKTRLAEECLALAERRGFPVRQASASAAAKAVPLGALAHLLPPGMDLSDPVRGFAAAAASLRSGGSRWILMVDDLHLIDATSLVLLRQLMDAGIVKVLGTLRTGEPLCDTLRSLLRGDSAHRMDIEAFDLTGTERVLRGVLGAPVGRRTAQDLFDASGGNPLYLREIVLGALRTGTLRKQGELWELADGRLPTTRRLAEVIAARLAPLEEDERGVLSRIAVCGPQSVSELCRNVPPSVIDRLESAALIEVAEERQRVTVRLAHPLYGEALREALPDVERNALMAEEADRIERHGARRRDDALRIASYRLAATGTADPQLLLDAACLASHSNDHPRVLTLLKALPDDRRSVGAQVLMGDALFQMGHWSAAEDMLSAACAAARGDEEVLAVAMTRVENLLGRAPLSAALEANAAALSAVTSPVGRYTLTVNEGYILISKGNVTEGLRRLEILEDDVQRAQYVTPWLRGVLTKALGLSLAGRTELSAAWARRGYDAYVGLTQEVLAPDPAAQKLPLVLALCEGGLMARAAHEGAEAYDQLSESSSVARMWMSVLLGRTQWLAGHVVSARHWYAEAIALARRVDNAIVLRPALSGLAACAAVQGDITAAESALEACDALPGTAGFLSEGELRAGRAWLEAARGNLTGARELLADGAASARATGHVTAESLLLTDIARLGAPHDVAQRLTELAGEGDGALLPVRAELAVALAASDAEALGTVALRCEELGADLLAAEAYSAGAQVSRRVGLPRAATFAENRAASCLTRCGDVRTPLSARSTAPKPLSEREREIAAAAMSGASSSAIAAALHVSVRTVNNHLHRVYTKLGVSDRRSLAQVLGAER